MSACATYINITPDTIEQEHICCIIREKKIHPGIEAKRQWLANRLHEGHLFRKLQVKGSVFIEYAPLSHAWVPIEGDSYMYIYCLWVSNEFTHQGYGKELLNYCIKDALEKGMSGICMLGSKKQKHWLADQSFAKKHGFKVVDTTEDGYELLALSFDQTQPSFCKHAKAQQIDEQELTIFYDMQCPFIYQNIEKIKTFCLTNDIPLHLHKIDTLQKAKELPCVFNNYGVFYKGKFVSVNLLDTKTIQKMIAI